MVFELEYLLSVMSLRLCVHIEIGLDIKAQILRGFSFNVLVYLYQQLHFPTDL